MERLGIDVLDLYLIHWPAPGQDAYVDAWQAMLELPARGPGPRSIGVCNFQVPHLQRLLDETGVLPSVNQVELSPYLQQRELRAFHAEHGIVTEAWSPLAVRPAARRPGRASSSPPSTRSRRRSSCCAGTWSSATSC